jgi:3',5'-cyclic AMP phosphodiesterase CpdA
MPPHRLRILHISDLHERALLDWMPSDRKTKVRATAPSRHRVLDPRRSNFFDIVREACTGGRADLVCFTGDAADWGLREEYERAARRLDAILEAAGASRERLYLVPGNHDVQRPKAEDTWEQLRTCCRRAASWTRRCASARKSSFPSTSGWGRGAMSLRLEPTSR